MLDRLRTWNLEDKTVLEFGGGWSTVWWSFYSKFVCSIETDLTWAENIAGYMRHCGLGNWEIVTPSHMTENSGKADKYLESVPPEFMPDIIVVDGIYRTETVDWAIERLKANGGTLICDNWQQDYVWISPAAEEMVKPYKGETFIQPNHTEHEGKPWCTGFWEIPKA